MAGLHVFGRYPYSGHATRQSLEIYSRLALADAQQRYDEVIGDFPV
jgi:integrase/recombinase XerD